MQFTRGKAELFGNLLNQFRTGNSFQFNPSNYALNTQNLIAQSQPGFNQFSENDFVQMLPKEERRFLFGTRENSIPNRMLETMQAPTQLPSEIIPKEERRFILGSYDFPPMQIEPPDFFYRY